MSKKKRRHKLNRHQRKKLYWKIGLIVGTLVFVVAALTAQELIARHGKEQEKVSQAEACEQAVAPLKQQRDELLAQVDELESQIAGDDLHMASVVIVCVEPNKKVITDLEPVLTEKGFTALVCCGESGYPGDEGCMTVAEAKSLVKKGWEFGLMLTEDSDVATLRKKLTRLGLPKPTAAYYPLADFEADIPAEENKLKQLGITTVLQYNFVPEESEAHQLNYISAYGCRESDGRTVLTNFVAASDKLAFTIGFSNSREIYAANSFDSMTTLFKNTQDNGKLKVTTVSEALARRQEFNAEIKDRKDRLTAKKEDLEWQLQNTEDAITQLYHQYID